MFRIVIYISSQFENSLGKLQAVTVKAPRQIIDVGVVSLNFFSSLVELSVDLSLPPAQSVIDLCLLSRCAALTARSPMATVLHLGQNLRELEPTTNRFFRASVTRRPLTFSPQVLIQIEGLYLALLNLESDQLKLHALPTGAPLREQVFTRDTAYCTIRTPIGS